MRRLLLTLALVIPTIGAKAWKERTVLNWDVKNAHVIVQKNQEGKLSTTYVSDFDENGNKLRRSRWTNEYGAVYKSECIEYTYDDQNHCLSEYRSTQATFEEGGLHPHEKYEFKYDAKGNLIERYYFYSEDFENLNYHSKEVYSYDSKNRCTSETVYMYSESMGFYEYDRMEHVYDSNGYEVEENYFSPIDDSWSQRWSIRYGYDKKGNRISKVTMNNTETGWVELKGSQYEYAYDAQGHLIQTLKLSDGKVVDKSTNTYNEQGQLIEEVSYEPSDLSNVSYKTIYEYDANGTLVCLYGKYYEGETPTVGSKNYFYYVDYKNLVTNTSGNCGEEGAEESLTWSLDSDGTLTISGAGAMMNYDGDNNSPWTIAKPLITKVVIGEGVTSIGDYAFYGCTELLAVEFSPSAKPTRSVGTSSLERIGKRSFKYCYSLEKLNFPESLTLIEGSAFEECVSVRNVACHSATPPTVNSSNFTETLWYDITNVLHVPTGTLEAYKNMEWTQYFTDIRDDADDYDVAVKSYKADEATASVRKTIDRQGRLVIEKDGKRYNALGVEER